MDDLRHILWAVHAIGPDELHPAKSFAEAARAAHRLNAFFLEKNPPEDDDYVMLWFNVCSWPYDAESHIGYIGDRKADSIFAQHGEAEAGKDE